MTPDGRGRRAYELYAAGRARPDGTPYFGWSELTPAERFLWSGAAEIADTRKPPRQYE